MHKLFIDEQVWRSCEYGEILEFLAGGIFVKQAKQFRESF